MHSHCHQLSSVAEKKFSDALTLFVGCTVRGSVHSHCLQLSSVAEMTENDIPAAYEDDDSDEGLFLGDMNTILHGHKIK